jgi:hypothetical protein
MLTSVNVLSMFFFSVTDLDDVTAAVVMLQIAIHEMLSSNLRQNINMQP